MLKVYGTPRSPPVNCVRFTANYLALDYEFVFVNQLEGEHRSEWYMKLHPAGKVPSIDDDGFTMFESVAICRYLSRKARSPLYPADISASAIVDAWSHFAENHVYVAICKVLFNHFFASMMGAEVDERSLREGREWLARFLPIVDARIGEHETELVRYNQHAGPVAQDLTGFGEDQLNQARVLVRLFAEIYRLGGGCDSIEIGIAAFALGDDFLCDDQDIAVQYLYAGCADPIDNHGGQFVSGTEGREFRDSLQMHGSTKTY